MSRNTSLVLYIGNGFVKGALVSESSNGKSKILYTEKENIPFQDDPQASKLESAVITSLDNLCKNIRAKGFPVLSLANESLKIDTVTCVLSAPWYISQTYSIQKKEEGFFTVKESIVEDLIKKIENDVESSHHDLDLIPIEKNILSISLNGYPVTSPFNKKTKNLNVSFLMSFSPRHIVESIKSTVQKHIRCDDFKIHSFSVAVFSVTRDIWPDTTHSIILDLTSEITELVLIKDGSISESISIPQGRNTLIRSISSGLGISTQVSESMLSLYIAGNSDISVKDKIEKAIGDAKKIWTGALSGALTEVAVGTSLPSNFLLVSQSDVKDIFSNFIKNEQYNQFTFAEGPFNVKCLSVEDVSGQCDFEKNTETDINIAFSAIFSKKLSTKK